MKRSCKASWKLLNILHELYMTRTSSRNVRNGVPCGGLPVIILGLFVPTGISGNRKASIRLWGLYPSKPSLKPWGKLGKRRGRPTRNV
jgi:hypothetical protein